MEAQMKVASVTLYSFNYKYFKRSLLYYIQGRVSIHGMSVAPPSVGAEIGRKPNNSYSLGLLQFARFFTFQNDDIIQDLKMRLLQLGAFPQLVS